MTNMDHTEFKETTVETLRMVNALLEQKGREYATDDDRFHNFVVGQEIAKSMFPEIKPSQVAFMFALKHIVSIMDMLKMDVSFTEERINEKINDTIVYLILIKAMLIKGN